MAIIVNNIFSVPTSPSQHSRGCTVNNSVILPPSEISTIRIVTRNINGTYTVESVSNSFGNSFAHAILAPNGMVYLIPFHNSNILKFNPNTRQLTSIATFSGEAKWHLATIGSDGCVYAAPFHATQVLKIDPSNDSVQLLGNFSGALKFWSAVAVGSRIYFIPLYATYVLIYNITSNSFQQIGNFSSNYKWTEGVLFNNRIYAMPEGSGHGILVIDTTNNSIRQIHTTTLVGTGSLMHGTFVGPDNMIYGVPYDMAQFVRLNPTTEQIELLGNFPGAAKWMTGGNINNRIILSPRQAGYIAEFYDDAWLATPISKRVLLHVTREMASLHLKIAPTTTTDDVTLRRMSIVDLTAMGELPAALHQFFAGPVGSGITRWDQLATSSTVRAANGVEMSGNDWLNLLIPYGEGTYTVEFTSYSNYFVTRVIQEGYSEGQPAQTYVFTTGHDLEDTVAQTYMLPALATPIRDVITVDFNTSWCGAIHGNAYFTATPGRILYNKLSRGKNFTLSCSTATVEILEEDEFVIAFRLVSGGNTVTTGRHFVTVSEQV